MSHLQAILQTYDVDDRSFLVGFILCGLIIVTTRLMTVVASRYFN